jgi:hypothetical protein
VNYFRNINFLSSRRLEKADVLFFSSDANKSETVVGGKRFDRYLDTIGSLAKSKGYSIKSISWPGSFYHGKKTWRETLNITWPFLIALAKDVFSTETESKTHRLSFFLYLLELVKPRVIFTIGEFDGFVRSAARSLGIPCVEVLHASGYHTSPDAWFATQELPSHVLAFDKVSKELLVEYCGRDSEIILTQDYWTNAWHQQPKDTIMGNGISLPKFAFTPTLSSAPYRIVVSLQWGYGGDSSRYVGKSRGEIFQNGLFPINLLKAMDDLGESAFWHFRLHPVQLNSRMSLYKKQRKYLDRLFEGRRNVDVLNASHTPLPSLLSECTHNITTSSSLCYEAAEFGIPTLTTSPLLLSGQALEARFQDLSREGYLTKVDPDFPGIANWVRGTSLMMPRHRSGLGRSVEDVFDGLIAGI